MNNLSISGWLWSTGTEAKLWSVSPQSYDSGGSLRSTPATPTAILFNLFLRGS